MPLEKVWLIRDLLSDGPPLSKEHAETKEAALLAFIERHPQWSTHKDELVAEERI